MRLWRAAAVQREEDKSKKEKPCQREERILWQGAI
jgi:hypothetical protein